MRKGVSDEDGMRTAPEKVRGRVHAEVRASAATLLSSRLHVKRRARAASSACDKGGEKALFHISSCHTADARVPETVAMLHFPLLLLP